MVHTWHICQALLKLCVNTVYLWFSWWAKNNFVSLLAFFYLGHCLQQFCTPTLLNLCIPDNLQVSHCYSITISSRAHRGQGHSCLTPNTVLAIYHSRAPIPRNCCFCKAQDVEVVPLLCCLQLIAHWIRYVHTHTCKLLYKYITFSGLHNNSGPFASFDLPKELQWIAVCNKSLHLVHIISSSILHFIWM